MRTIQLFRAVVSALCLFGLTTTLPAQFTVENLIGSSVDEIDDRYRLVSDGMALFQKGNGPAALSTLRDAKKQRPELPPGEVMFAQLCFASNNPKPGREALQGAAVTFKDDPEVWNILADLQLREGNLAEAELLFRHGVRVASAFEQNPKRKSRLLAGALAGVAMANERRGLWAEAEAPLRAWLKLMPQSEEVSSRLATVLINTGRFDEAKQTLEQLHQLNPNQLPAEIVLGVAYDRNGKPDQAKASMLAGLRKYPENFATQMAVAGWALNNGETELALQCAAAAEKLDPSSFLPSLVVAQVDYLRGDFAKAEVAFHKVYQAKPGNYDAVNGLALAILAQNDESKYKLALEYAELLAKNHNDLRTAQGRQAASLMAWALFHNNRPADAERLIAGMLNSGPITPSTAYFAAVILQHQGKQELALEALTKALSSTTSFPYYVQAEKLKAKLEAAKATAK